MVLSSADIFRFFVVVVFHFFPSKCRAVWIQILPVGSDLGLCLQRLSAGDTSK